MTSRREALALLGAIAAAACAGPRPAARTGTPAPAPLKLEPLVDLIPAAGLVWLIEARPAELLRSAALGPPISLLAPDDRFATFARRHGGVDLREASDVCVAGFGDSTLALGRAPFEPGRVEHAFAERAASVEGRAMEHGITRLWGTVGDEREQVAVFGRDVVGVERGRFGPLRTAELFATGKLRRALPALRADPLLAAAERLGDAPLRAFAPGPFQGSWAAGLGGLLRAALGAGVALRPVDSASGAAALLSFVLLGAWGDDAPAAADRLGAAFRVLADDPLGRLARVDRPKDGPHTSGDGAALTLNVTLDPVALARGLRDATEARVSDIMAL